MKLFKKPTEEEVKNQFEIKGILDKKPPQVFYAHYESVGWYVGKRKMVSWKGAVAKWILRMDEFNPQNNGRNTNNGTAPADYSRFF